ncbi:hypothetical protein [Acinetobacter vivianii]|uniref:hypothetical protein n=1 Tax=Acinetobacter vivianii TaxID=1776742 RepID=UPI002DB8D336|nr:hypothetical protein [Acinetobacter vivianii]MEB6480094.1 hypothetical protein [Acinetobacter vivianii]MEB6658145.1 hypothetical protein [Acinetobacter vivianii]
MRKSIIVILLIVIFSSVSCSKKTIYLTPEVTGFIYDSNSKEPLGNKKGYISFSLPTEKTPKQSLKSSGKFVIYPLKKEYYIFKPDISSYKDVPLQIYIYIDGYEGEILDYSKFFWRQVPKEKIGFYSYNKVEVGKVYLDPEK